MMGGRVVGLVAAAALMASVGIANAKGPVKLTDAQLDKVTAGASNTSVNVAATQQLNTLLAANTQQLNNQLAIFNAFSTFLTTPILP
jgi:hypothetical protein